MWWLFPGKNAGFMFHFVGGIESVLESKISRAKQNQCDAKHPVHCVGRASSRKSTGTSKTTSAVSIGMKLFHNS